MDMALDFNDILLIPYNSGIRSRDEVDLSVELSPFLKLKFPIIVSPMKGIISSDLVSSLSDIGGIGILHRFYENRRLWLEDINFCCNSVENYGVAVGEDTPDDDVLFALGNGAKILCFDVANGYTRNVLHTVDHLRKLIDENNHKCLLMAGNVVTEKGARGLVEFGADLVRVGIGSGNLCTTRTMTGVGIPQLQALYNCKDFNCIVADGGIRNSGDIVKALAFGAQVVMVGSLFARTFESSHNGIIYGMASRKLQEEYYHSVKSVEGLEQDAEKNISARDLVSEICWNLKSACTYLGVRTLKDLEYMSNLRMSDNRLYVRVR